MRQSMTDTKKRLAGSGLSRVAAPAPRKREIAALPGKRRQRQVVAPKPGAANSTADRAIDILLLFSEDRPIWSTTEIAEHFDMPRTTTYRYISSLRSYALIVEDESGGYRLGPKIFPLARVAKASTSIMAVAAPHLLELNRTFGEAVTLYERIGHESIALDRFESRHRVKMMYSRGQMLPWPGAASAKVLLAHAPPGEQEAIFRLLVPVRYTAKTVKSLKLLRLALKKIRSDGYVYSDQEREEGVRAIAAPIFSAGDGRYCVTMSGPLFRITAEKLSSMISMVRKTAQKISGDLKKTEY
jgi:DNA-binding IclR family transcriptional regulator